MHDQVMEFKSGGGFIALVGLVFASVGTFMVVVAGQIMMQSEASGGWVIVIAVGLGGLVGALIGLALIVGRIGVRIDVGSGIVLHWIGGLGYRRGDEYKLSVVNAVEIGTTTQPGDRRNTVITVFAVNLDIAGKPLQLATFRDYQQARGRAESVAKFIGRDLHDKSEGTLEILTAEQFDQSVRGRARSTGEEIVWPEAPAESRIGYQTSDDVAILDLPSVEWKELRTTVLGLAMVWGVPGVLVGAIRYGSSIWGDTAIQFGVIDAGLLAGFVGLPIVVLCMVAWFGLTRDRVEVSRHELKIVRRYPIWKRTWGFEAHELEELDFERIAGERRANKSDGALMCRSDRHACTFGAWLKPKERQWLLDVLRYVLLDTPR